MNGVEMSNAFDIRYNSIAGQNAPGIDAFEKSSYLTKAQLEIIKNYYDPNSNRKQKGFEGSEKRRVDLKELIKDYKISSAVSLPSSIYPTAKFYNLPDDVFLLVNEKAKVISEDCNNNLIIKVKPVTYDEFNTQIKNPFKTPDKNIAWRLDISKIDNKQVVEIISPYNITGLLEYQIRYLKYPKPIILADLNTTFPGENLTIEGIQSITDCELHTEIHDEIVDRAVQLAIRDYKKEGLESKVQLDMRNE
jgi:hypothetical protein